MNIVGNRNGMNPVKAMQAAKKADCNRDGVIEKPELQFSAKVLKGLDQNNDHRLQVKELARGLANGDVFINVQQREIHAFPRKALKLV